MKLSNCIERDLVKITGIKGDSDFKKRMFSFGIIPGKRLIVVKYAPLGDPLEIELIGGTHISLRKAEAESIEVELIERNSRIFKRGFGKKRRLRKGRFLRGM